MCTSIRLWPGGTIWSLRDRLLRGLGVARFKISVTRAKLAKSGSEQQSAAFPLRSVQHPERFGWDGSPSML